MKKQHISEAVIRRLPRYYRYLDDLHNKGVIRISSNSLGSKMGIMPAQAATTRRRRGSLPRRQAYHK